MKTKRLILRPLCDGDANWIPTEISGPEVHRWLTSPPCPYTVADAVAFIERNAELPGCRVIEEEGTPCGVVTITIDRPGFPLPDLGYWLGKSAWGRGLMTEAAQAMLDWYFDDKQALESGWIEGNAASENVLSKLGFQKTGETRMIWSHFHGQDMPVTRVRLDRARWAEVSRGDVSAVQAGLKD